MDLNQLYFDHQLLLMKARRTRSVAARRTHEVDASVIAGRIGCMQRALGAAGALTWEAIAAHSQAPLGSPPHHQPGCAS